MDLESFREAIAHLTRFQVATPKVMIMADMLAMCMNCAAENKNEIEEAIRTGSTRNGWFPIGVEINREDDCLYCCHCNKPVESAYGPDDNDLEEVPAAINENGVTD